MDILWYSNMGIKNTLQKLKKSIMGNSLSEVVFVCLNCGEEFEGIRVEIFIKHQIDNKHFEWTKKFTKKLDQSK